MEEMNERVCGETRGIKIVEKEIYGKLREIKRR